MYLCINLCICKMHSHPKYNFRYFDLCIGGPSILVLGSIQLDLVSTLPSYHE